VLGVQFKPLAGLTAGHLGAFWHTLGPEWPEVGDAAALPEQYEGFGSQPAWGKLRLTFSREPTTRLQIRNKPGTRMLQLQNCRFDLNWLGQSGQAYPRYAMVRPEFDKRLDAFVDFLRRQDLGDPEATQWEVTYVNHLPKGTVWTGPDDWHRAFRGLLAATTTPEELLPETLHATWRFEITPRRGRLHIELTHHGRTGPPTYDEALVLKLTARGPVPESASPETMGKGLDLGHDTIVNAFTRITAPEAQEYWNRDT
jgi:uncharacterized protein (TIGR04255 family)